MLLADGHERAELANNPDNMDRDIRAAGRIADVL
jgi:hypothetical protein